MIAVGLMSGTSGDGVDAAAIQLDVPAKGDVRVLFTASARYPTRVREAVIALGEGGTADAREIARLHGLLGDEYAKLAARVSAGLRARPDVIAMHGQTVAHLPDEHVTFQIGDAARIARRTGVPTVADFRSADIAAGGQGAPLVPFADFVLFARLAPVAVLNIGGIANLTLIPSDRADDVVAFDTGPGNMVIDGVAAVGPVGATHDSDGQAARRGKIDPEALAELLADPYFGRRAPKSTGREDFGAPFAKRLLDLVTKHRRSHDDALATATALTARSIADALGRESTRPATRLLVAGGGARNPTLVAMLRDAVAALPVETTDTFGVPAAYREAIAFAILAAYRLRGLPNTLPRATGASRAVSGGALHIP